MGGELGSVRDGIGGFGLNEVFYLNESAGDDAVEIKISHVGGYPC